MSTHGRPEPLPLAGRDTVLSEGPPLTHRCSQACGSELATSKEPRAPQNVPPSLLTSGPNQN